MKTALRLQNARVYDVKDYFDILIGQQFALDVTEQSTPVQFFSNNDKAIDFEPGEMTVTGVAKNVGTCILIIMDSNYTAIKRMTITIFEVEANRIGIVAGEPEPK
jgi:hypothetical protein